MGLHIRLSISLVKGALTLGAAILLGASADALRLWRIVVYVVHELRVCRARFRGIFAGFCSWRFGMVGHRVREKRAPLPPGIPCSHRFACSSPLTFLERDGRCTTGRWLRGGDVGNMRAVLMR